MFLDTKTYKKAVLFFMSVLLGIFSLKAQDIRIIPCPNKMEIGSGDFIINKQTCIICESGNQKIGEQLQAHLEQFLGYKIDIKKAGEVNVIEFVTENNLANEAYKLIIDSDKIQIKAAAYAGWFYGIQSLKQLLPSISATGEQFSELKIQKLEINDAPRFSWRAFMLDESRNFQGADQVKMLLDEMALLKMNVFHWHLVDDQGWRIEIKKYPLLTKIGSKRESTQLVINRPIQSGEPHEGFYTQKEIKEIIEYAKERNITIVPEIEMPGHSSAAIAAYPWLGITGKKIEVPTYFGVSENVYDISNPKVFSFLTDVLDEVIALFPSKVIHIGGDEVRYNHWEASESINNYMKENNISSYAELQVLFTNRISHYLESKGRRMMGWNEILGQNIHDYQQNSDVGSSQKLVNESIIHFWDGNQSSLSSAADDGFSIVNSYKYYTYLDYNYSRIPLSKSYAFDPVPADFSEANRKYIIGTGCQMWGEWIPTNGQMHFQVFPRIAAYAEVGWTDVENKDFDSFKGALKKLQEHWKQEGIYFAPDSEVEGKQEKK